MATSALFLLLAVVNLALAACPPGTAGVPPNCSACLAGRFSDGTLASCSPCSSGYWCPVNSTNATSNACAAGRYSAGPGISQDSCLPCANATWSSHGASNCTNCSSGAYCPPGSADSLGTRSPLATPTPTASIKASLTASPVGAGLSTAQYTPSASTSSSPSPSHSLSYSLSPQWSQSAPSTLTRTPIPSFSAAATATPTTPPPFTCENSDGGCQVLTGFSTALAAPFGPGLSASQPPADRVQVSWPLVTSDITVTLPTAPSSGEELTATLTDDSNGFLAYNSSLARCPSTPAFCLVLRPGRVSFTVTVASSSNSSFAGTINCTIASRYLSAIPTTSLPFPRYRQSTLLAPTSVTSYPLSAPLLSAIFRETYNDGVFVALGDASVHTIPALPPCDYLSPPAHRTSFWESASMPLCEPALTAVRAMNATLANRSVSVTAGISGATHLILAAQHTPFPPTAAQLRVMLGGVNCTVNWVTANFASITTPEQYNYCNSAAASAGTACGDYPLLLAIVAPAQYLPVYTAYPPLLPSRSWSNLAALVRAPNEDFTRYTSLRGYSLQQLAVQATSPPLSSGLTLLRDCSDATFSSIEECSTNAPLLLKRCLWGNGSVCRPCPTGAACPGGPVLLPLAGYWLAASSSPYVPELFKCPSSDRSSRCPGLQSAGPYQCGAGYQGQACAACAGSYYLEKSGSCRECPSLIAGLKPVLYFIAGLLVLGLAIILLLYGLIRYHDPPNASLAGAILPVRNLLVWSWVTAQTLASLFFQVQSQSLAPAYMEPYYTALGALQFRAIPLDPACYSLDENTPYIPLITCLVAVACCYCLAGMSLCCLRKPGGAWEGFFKSLLYLVFLALSLAYGSFTTTILSNLLCTSNVSMTVIEYLQTKNDCVALKAAFGSDRDCLALLAASRTGNADPKVTVLLQEFLSVSLLAGNPYQVCSEAAHRHWRPVSYLLFFSFTLALPLFTMAVLWHTGHLKCIRRSPVLARVLHLAPPQPPSSQPHLELLREALVDPSLLASKTWYPSFQQLQLALISLMSALASAELPGQTRAAPQIVIILASAAGCLIALRMRLFKSTDAWKSSVLIVINLVVAITAVINATLVLAKSSLSDTNKFILAATPLALSTAAVCILLYSWGRSMSHYTLKFTPPPPITLSYRTAHPWLAVRTAEGDYMWLNDKLQESLWELPDSAVTACGWRHEGELWVNDHLETASPTPPSAKSSYQRRKWRRVAGLSESGESAVWFENTVTREASWVLPPGGLQVRPKLRPLCEQLSLQHTAQPPPNQWMPLKRDGYWGNALGEAVHTLPAGATTTCGWAHNPSSQLWLHAESGALSLRQPIPGNAQQATAQRCARARSELYRASLTEGSEWTRSPDEQAWLQPCSGQRATSLPAGAHTTCGWWQESGQWVHTGSGATLFQPPPLSSKAAMHLIVHYLYAVSSRICEP